MAHRPWPPVSSLFFPTTSLFFPDERQQQQHETDGQGENAVHGAVPQQTGGYPSSSRRKTNWDALAKDADKEEEEATRKIQLSIFLETCFSFSGRRSAYQFPHS